jgi:F0F1-type ATP synthase assembly protein I
LVAIVLIAVRLITALLALIVIVLLGIKKSYVLGHDFGYIDPLTLIVFVVAGLDSAFNAD